MAYRLFKHKDYDESIKHLPRSIQHKATWAQVLLGMRGRTPSVKGTTGRNARWRRTPVQGNHYYMWWIPRSESLALPATLDSAETSTILIHSIRHHDETDDPIDVGTLADYEEVAVTHLDPRYAEQVELSQRVTQKQIALATIKGLPGSGKTVSLFYLVKELAQRPGMRNVLYVTYTSRLKRAAREFLLVQDEAISQAVTIRTLNEIEHDLTNLPTASEPFSELRDFTRFVEAQSNATLGPWKRYPQTLYTELRAHLLGKSFPVAYTLPEGRLNSLLLGEDGLSAATYAQLRGLELETATLAYNFGERLRNGRYFQDQRAAQRAIELLRRGRSPGWLAELDALIVDEVQDLTLVQIALLGELVRARLRRRPAAPFVFTVAGDESQIVQPSGFDWGITKELLGEQIGIWPEEFEFHYQRRSPRNLAELIDNTWRLYGYLPKEQRPSARRQAFVYEPTAGDDEQYGRILLCPPPPSLQRKGQEQSTAWQALVHELADKPGRVLIDLSETLHKLLANDQHTEADEALFLAREIKGLERATVLIYGLNALYEQALDLCENHVDDQIPRFEARRLFDEIRVALSRSTEKIVLLEPANAPVLQELGIHEIPGVSTISWEALTDTLQTEEMSELEVIEGYLEEVDELFERGLWEQGYRRNRRAFVLALELGDLALQREAQEQHVNGYLQEAGHWISEGQWVTAHTCNRQAHLLVQQFGDPLLEEEVEEQHQAIGATLHGQAVAALGQMQNELERHQYLAAQQSLQLAQRLTELINLTDLLAQVDEATLLLHWAWATRLTTGDYTAAAAQQAATLLREASEAMQRQSDVIGAQATYLLAERYTNLPQPARLDEEQTARLLTYAERYLQLVKPLSMDATAYGFVERWLEEIYANLHFRTSLYFRWAVAGQELDALSTYAALDEHLWDLENRLNHLMEQGKRSPSDPDVARFLALVATYNGDAQAASTHWEQLGELARAADYAREAGDLERAFRLYHQAKSETPEALATAVRATRLLQQLQSKHTGLRPAERRTLLGALGVLQEALVRIEGTIEPNRYE
jgi:hypothetical protein